MTPTLLPEGHGGQAGPVQLLELVPGEEQAWVRLQCGTSLRSPRGCPTAPSGSPTRGSHPSPHRARAGLRSPGRLLRAGACFEQAWGKPRSQINGTSIAPQPRRLPPRGRAEPPRNRSAAGAAPKRSRGRGGSEAELQPERNRGRSEAEPRLEQNRGGSEAEPQPQQNRGGSEAAGAEPGRFRSAAEPQQNRGRSEAEQNRGGSEAEPQPQQNRGGSEAEQNRSRTGAVPNRSGPSLPPPALPPEGAAPRPERPRGSAAPAPRFAHNGV
ncbi:translation initiation factor IF-2-like [Melozone crissalis]|uniref:translation initiation factor IF-2-like n=1 Tax=Melozone crissalis TaxID=40204 RepID=UPI0023DB45C5|nr:translation initiation factor IF-2-like [Melozone crissalis]